MAYLSAIGCCFVCQQPFSFNPDRVPSFQGNPICKRCITWVNQRRAENGLATWPVYDDAYDAQEVEC